jgi:hypothetical protein
MRLFLLALFVTVVALLPVRADPVTTARSVIDDFVVPRVEAFATRAAEQALTFEMACGRTPIPVDTLRAAFQSTADAWNAVNIVRHGPVTEDFRVDRIYMWPERRNGTTKAVAGLLAKTGTDDLTDAAFAQASAAAQGLPALERILYDADAETLFATAATAERRCAVGLAMSRHLASLAAEVAVGWTGPAGLAARVKSGGEAAAVEALTRLATDLIASYQVHADQRLSPVLGTGPGAAKPTLAEFRRSGRASRALRIEIEATVALFTALTGSRPEAEAARAPNAAMLAAAKTPITDLAETDASAEGRKLYVAVRERVRDAQDATKKALPAALGITLGFNSLDGD